MERQELVIEDDSSVDSEAPKVTISTSIPTKIPSNPPKSHIKTPAKPQNPQLHSSLDSSQPSKRKSNPHFLVIPHRKQLRPLGIVTDRPRLSRNPHKFTDKDSFKRPFETSFPVWEREIPVYDVKKDKNVRNSRIRRHFTVSGHRKREKYDKKDEFQAKEFKLPPIRQKSSPGMTKNPEATSEFVKNPATNL